MKIKSLTFKNLLLLLTIVLFTTSFIIHNKTKQEILEIAWMDFQEGYDLAVKSKKPIVIDMYTDWCGWCKKMDRSTFSNKDVIEKLNNNFIAIKFNPEKEGKYMVQNNIMTGQELKLWLGGGKHYGYPTSYFWMQPHENNAIKMEVGFKDAITFEKLIDSYLKDR